MTSEQPPGDTQAHLTPDEANATEAPPEDRNFPEGEAMTVVDNETATRAFTIATELMAPNDQPYEGPLWHYTDAGGARGVLQHGLMWATDADYMNDTSELRTLSRMMLELASARAEQAPSERATRLARMCAWQYHGHLWTTYVVSFSTLEDDLTQWRAYGGDGGGYAVMFDPSKLVRPVPGVSKDVSMPMLVRCEYPTPEDLQALAETVLDAVTAALDEDDDHSKLLAEMILAVSVALSAPTHKATAYRGEAEVRLVVLGQSRQTQVDDARSFAGRKARLRGDLFVPYVEVDVSEAILAVWAGPKHVNEGRRTGYGLRSFLDSVDRTTLPIRFSENPYRG